MSGRDGQEQGRDDRRARGSERRHRRIGHIRGQRPDVRGLPPEEDVERELRAHLEQTVEDLTAQGWGPEQARKEAMRRFGDVAAHAAAARKSTRRRDRKLRLAGLVEAAEQDARLTMRSMLRRPGFTLAVVLILGVGIGATVTIYAVFDNILLRPLPYREPARLIRVDWRYGFPL
jgi:hypothetical protein